MSHTPGRVSHLNAVMRAARKHTFGLSVGLTLTYAFGLLVYAQVCHLNLSTNLRWMSKELRDGFGIMHVSVNLAGGDEGAPSAQMRQAMEAALAEWNTYKCQTGVVFELSTLGGGSDLEFAFTADESGTGAGGCARYDPAITRVYYGNSLKNRLTSLGAVQTAAVFKHELGHFLGLGHTTIQTTIMNQAPCSSPVLVTSVSLADAEKAGSCMGAGTPCPTPTPTPTPTPECTAPPPPEGAPVDRQCATPFFPCDTGAGEEWDPAWCMCVCAPPTPVLVDVAGDGFRLTDATGGVYFNIDGDGAAERLSWTEADSDDAWLAFDRDGDGAISSGRELFGNHTPQPDPPAGEGRNGFLALAEFDRAEHGGNGDGVIDSRDAVFPLLHLWQDINHNGVSETDELSSLPESGLAELSLGYKESRRTDEYGNRFRYRAKVRDAHGSRVARWAWDVFLVAGK